MLLGWDDEGIAAVAAGWLAGETGAVWLRIDEIENALRRHGLTAEQTGVAAYGVAHDVAASHLRRGLTVIADAVSPVAEARLGWRDLAASVGCAHVVIETVCPDTAEHRRRVETRASDLPGWVYPSWYEEVERAAAHYQTRADERLQLDTTRPIPESHRAIKRHLQI
jgi:chloramphenicol 3-O-phosphotransferase